MIQIELLGPSGAGKTTLFSEFIKNRKTLETFYTPEEALIKIAKTQIKKNYTINRRTFLKWGFLKKHHGKWSKDILIKYFPLAEKEIIPYYENLIKRSFISLALDENYEIKRRIQMLNFYYGCFKNIFLLNYFGFNDVVLFDDGILHNYSGTFFSEDLDEIFSMRGSKERILPSAAIFCNISEEGVFARRKKRIKEGKGTFLEVGLNDFQLRMLCKTSQKKYFDKILFLKKQNIPTLELDMLQPLDENIITGLNFIEKLKMTQLTEHSLPLFK